MKKLLAILLSVTLLWSNMTYAEDPAPTKPGPPYHLMANKSFTPTVDGWFFTDAQEQKMRYRLVDADYLEKELKLNEKLVENYKKIADTQEQIAEKYKLAFEASNEQLTKVLQRENRTKFWYTTLGVLLTVGAGLAIGFAAKSVK